jgi:D-sedoheptulose 7-phosphate isomerase
MQYLNKYIQDFKDIIEEFREEDFSRTIQIISETQARGGKLIFVGNGGSAAMASHLSVDFTKACNIRSICFNEADLLTCFSNDFGYEQWVVKALEYYADPADLVFLISSSGSSNNIINAANYCKSVGIQLVTLSGFNKTNPLRDFGEINCFVKSDRYNYVEMAHHLWLVALVDRLSIDLIS